MSQVMKTTNKVSNINVKKNTYKNRRREKYGNTAKKRGEMPGERTIKGRDRIIGTKGTGDFKNKGKGGGQGEERTDSK